MGKYEKLLALGQGASADVFLVRHTRTQQLFAVKKVRLIPGKRLRDKAAVLQEVAILQQLRHPHVVACHDHFFDADEQHIFIVQDYCDGGSLDEHIRGRREGHFSEGTVMRWFVQLALAIQYIHTLQILHRDIKAANVFLTRARQRLKLGDFGIATVLDSTGDLASTFVGTPYYLSPELCQDVPYSAKADIWALGCLLFELCALRPPFAALSLISLFKKIVEEDHGPIPRCYSEALWGLIRATLQKDPGARPSADALLGIPYVQEHLRLFRLQEEPQPLPKRRPGVFQEGLGGAPPSSPGQALAPRSSPQQQAEQPNDPEEGLSISGSDGSHYSADFEQSSTSSAANSSDGDTPSPAEATATAASEEEEEWEQTDCPTDFEDSEEGSLGDAENDLDGSTQGGQSCPSSSPLGGSQKCSGEAGPCWPGMPSPCLGQRPRKEEDGSCGGGGGGGGSGGSSSDDGSSASEAAAAAQACLQHSSSTEDSEHWEACCYLLRMLDLDSP